MFRPKFWALSGMIALGLAVQAASAGTVSYTLSGTGSDGPISATVTFTTVAGGLDVTVANNASGTIVKSQAISSLAFDVSGIGAPTAFTELKGRTYSPVAGASWTLASGTPFDHFSSSPPVNSIDHWGFSINGSSLLATASSPVPGAGNPQYMILPSAGTAGSGNSLANSNFDPYIIGPADFFLTVSGMTAGTTLTADNFTGLAIGFGTGPDTFLGTKAVPLPAALPAGLAMLGLLAWARRANRKNRV